MRSYISVDQFRNLFNCLVIYLLDLMIIKTIFFVRYAFATARKRFRTGFQKVVIIKLVGARRILNKFSFTDDFACIFVSNIIDYV